MKIRIATRESELALVQARYTAARLEKELGAETELVAMTTTGDEIQSVALSKIGGKGLFVKEIEEALFDGRADVAVHSAKDLPAAIPEGLELKAFPVREDPRDALVSMNSELRVANLPKGGRIGTGSTRRTSQLLAMRPDLELVPLRGNVQTRLRKLEEQNLDAVILACAGLDRLNLSDRITERIDTSFLLPSVAQGTLALETRCDDPIGKEVAKLNQADVELTIRAERSFSSRLEADCSVPVAGHAVLLDGGRLQIRGLIAMPDGSRVLRAEAEGDAGEGVALGLQVAESLLADGADEILAFLRGSHENSS